MGVIGRTFAEDVAPRPPSTKSVASPLSCDFYFFFLFFGINKSIPFGSPHNSTIAERGGPKKESTLRYVSSRSISFFPPRVASVSRPSLLGFSEASRVPARRTGTRGKGEPFGLVKVGSFLWDRVSNCVRDVSSIVKLSFHIEIDHFSLVKLCVLSKFLAFASFVCSFLN